MFRCSQAQHTVVHLQFLLLQHWFTTNNWVSSVSIRAEWKPSWWNIWRPEGSVCYLSREWDMLLPKPKHQSNSKYTLSVKCQTLVWYHFDSCVNVNQKCLNWKIVWHGFKSEIYILIVSFVLHAWYSYP